MELERSLLKAFSEAVADNGSNESKYVRGTARIIGDTKFVQIDGYETFAPISETVDIQEGDRVLVSIENHRATILGNFSYPPSARKEEEALGKAEDAIGESSIANQKAQEAITEANKANSNASNAITHAEEAIAKAEEAQNGVTQAQQDIIQAKQDAEDAKVDASNAHKVALEAQGAVAETKNEIGLIEQDVESVRGNIDSALAQLEAQAGELDTVKETYSTKIETENVKAELNTEISKKVGELQTTMSKEYAAKSDLTTLEGKLQTQITQNADGLASQATKIEKVESDTAAAQEKVDAAKELASQAQNIANDAVNKANAAQDSADSAKANADMAADKAQEASDKALQAAIDARVADEALTKAKTALDEAKKNYELLVSNPNSTPEQIQEAQRQVDIANDNVVKALAAAATASYAANKAQEDATKAQEDAAAAQGIAQEAQNKADDAKKVADKAQADAVKAQEDVAALTKRVVTAETNISQNAEAIELNATKTEEIGNELKNNYYTKTESDAAIKLSADSIKSEVSQTYSTKSNTIASSVEQFYLSDSPYSLSEGVWLNDQPTWTQGKYIWRRMQVTYGDGQSTYLPSAKGVCITGNTGDPGDAGPAGPPGEQGIPGKDGVGVKTTEVTYQVGETQTSPPTGEWTTTIPEMTEEFPYLWTRTVITYTDNTTSTSYSVSSMSGSGDIQIGARNLILHSDQIVNNADYGMVKYTLSTDMIADQVYTCTIWGQLGEGKTNFSIHLDGTAITLGYLVDKGGNRHVLTFRGKAGTLTPSELHVCAAPDTVTGIPSIVSKIKLEIGNKPTDWTPAPEDTRQNIDDAIDQSEYTIREEYRSLIDQTSEQINLMINNLTEITNENESSITNLSNQLQMTSEMAQFVKTTTEKLQSVVDGKVSESQIREWARFDGANLELGASNQPFKCKLSTTELAFYEGSNKVAWISNNELNILTAIIAKSIGCGNYTFVDEGELGFSLI